MGKRCWLIGDTHFGQDSIYGFHNYDGTRVRPWAENAKDGDEIIIDNWNKIVGKNDRVYHLGDVATAKVSLSILDRLNGKKVLIKGNHDIYKLKDYEPYFEDIRGVYKLDRFWLTHVPVHPKSLPKWCRANIHGHLHGNVVLLEDNITPDKRYFNVSLEAISAHTLGPIDLEQIRSIYYN